MKKFICIVSIITLLGLVGCNKYKIEIQNSDEMIDNSIIQSGETEAEISNKEANQETNSESNKESNKENSRKILSEYATSSLQMSNDEFEKNLIDINQDGDMVLVQIIDEYPGGLRLWCIDDANKVVEMEVLNKTNNEPKELYDANYMIYETTDNTIDNTIDKTVDETIDKTSNEVVYFLSEYFADGLCYENRTLYTLEKNGTKLFINKIFNYACDDEKEEEKTNEILQNKNLKDEEVEAALMNAHVMNYSIGEENVTEEKFNNYITDLKAKYECTKIINDYVLEFNKSKLVDFISADIREVESAHIGHIRLNDSEYILTYDKIDEDTFGLIAHKENYEDKVELAKWNVNDPIEDTELTIFNNKYLVVALVNPYNSGVQSVLKIYDETMSQIDIGNVEITYDEMTKEFKYNFSESKISLSAYEIFEPTSSDVHNLYRVDYELQEKDGKLMRTRIAEDKEDTKFTAAN